MMRQIGLSTGACTHRSILDVLPSICDSGVVGIEISTPPRHFDPWQEAEITCLQNAVAALALRPISIHAPFGGDLDLAHPDPRQRDAAVSAVLTAATAIKRLGGELVIVHPSDLDRRWHDPPARLADSAQSLARLAERCGQENLTLVIESPLPHLIGGHPDEFRRLLDVLDASVRVCLDTGHTTLGGHWRRFFEVADGRTLHIHAHDNHGHADDHLPPGEGRIDWREIGRTLAAADFEGWIMLELLCPPQNPAEYFRQAVANTRRLLAT